MTPEEARLRIKAISLGEEYILSASVELLGKWAERWVHYAVDYALDGDHRRQEEAYKMVDMNHLAIYLKMMLTS